MNKKTKLFTITIVSVLTGGVFLPHASAEIEVPYTSNALINFVPNVLTIPPLNPENPNMDNPISPINPDGSSPSPGTGGDLSIDFSSSLSFGSQPISLKDQIYKAQSQQVLDDDSVPNFIQISDQRMNYEGWELSVSQPTQFHMTTVDPNETPESSSTPQGYFLSGASINFTKGMVKGLPGHSDVPDNVVSSFSLVGDGVQQPVLSASNSLGTGTWLYSFGESGDYSSTSSPITLSIPGGTPKRAANYTTEIVWTLSMTPLL